MSKTDRNLEKRVEKLEKELASLKRVIASKVNGSWRKMFGSFADDPSFDEAVRLGQEYRRQVNEESLRELDSLSESESKTDGDGSSEPPMRKIIVED